MSSYARDLGVSAPTIKRWLSILEASYIIFVLPPYYDNVGKRLIKSPKVYFYDTGLVSYLTGITTFEHYDQGPLAGNLFENYVISEIVKNELHTATHNTLYFSRTQDKAEIDLIIDRRNSKVFIEIKKSATFTPKMVRTLLSHAPADSERVLLYSGERYEHRGVKILPFGEYLSALD
jgi:hypothetical protein